MPKLELWRKYVLETVKRYKGTIRAWEVGNEPNFQYFWRPKPDPAEYAVFLKETYRAVKEADPDALTVSMSTSGCDVKFIESVLKAGGDKHTEAVSVHPYADAKGPEAAGQNRNLEKLGRLLEEYGIRPRIWLTEMGWGTYTADPKNGVTPELQADYLVRGLALALGTPGVEKAFWFCYRDFVEPLAKDAPKDWEYTRYYGLVDQELKPKPAYHAHQILARELKGTVFDRRLEAGDNAYALLFSGERAGGRGVLDDGRAAHRAIAHTTPGSADNLGAGHSQSIPRR